MLSDEGPMLETLDYTIRIGSTPTFLYFDLYCIYIYIYIYIYGVRSSGHRIAIQILTLSSFASIVKFTPVIRSKGALKRNIAIRRWK